jgi:DNA-binding response OmpR family regulator
MTWSASPGGPAGQARVGVIDSDSAFVRALAERLQTAGWMHRVLASPVPFDALAAMRLNAIVVDLAVLGPQGWSYLGRLCAQLPDVGVVVCTGPSSAAQRVRGLRLGADDWISKPCHPDELMARLEAVVRRRRRVSSRLDATPIAVGELELRHDRFQGYVGGESVELTRREYELIELLAEAAGQVLERGEIYQRVWGYEMVHGDRSVDVFVRKLRAKLQKASPTWRYIHTHFGIGYRFAAERAVREPLGSPEPVTGPEPDVPDEAAARERARA